MLLTQNEKYLLEIPVNPAPHGDLPNTIVKVFADNGTLGFLVLAFFVGAYLFDLKGFLADCRSGFKALGEIATKLDTLSKEHDKSVDEHVRNHNEVLVRIEKLDAHIEKMYEKLQLEIRSVEPCQSFKRAQKDY